MGNGQSSGFEVIKPRRHKDTRKHGDCRCDPPWTLSPWLRRLMQSQKALVDIVGKFTPKIVKMDGAKHKSWSNRTPWEKKGNRDEVVGE